MDTRNLFQVFSSVNRWAYDPLMGGAPESHTGWTFITNHARVLAAIAENQNARVRDIAAHCRLTERAVQKIISDLEESGYLSHRREGRGNAYQIQPGTELRHPAEAGLTVTSLLALLVQVDAHHSTHAGADGQASAGT